jgi:hypothetical protein
MIAEGLIPTKAECLKSGVTVLDQKDTEFLARKESAPTVVITWPQLGSDLCSPGVAFIQAIEALGVCPHH